MSYWKQIEITDDLSQNVKNTQNGEMRTIEPFRSVGEVFQGSNLNPYFWTSTNTNGGTVAQSNGVVTLATNTTANGATQYVTVKTARYVGQTQDECTIRAQFPDGGTTNNVRRWGVFNGTDGAYFKLNGTALSVNTMKGGVETSVASGSWLVAAPDVTKYNGYQILYTNGTVNFIVNQVLVYKVSVGVSTSSSWANTISLPLWMDNVNSGGSVTNVSMNVRVATIYRFGKRDTQDQNARLTTAGTYNLKYGPGTMHRITLNTPTGTLITVYDNTAGSGTVIAAINTPAQANPVTLEYHVEFNIGLTIVTTGTWDATVVYQ